MLNNESIPVWILADSLLAILVLGGISGIVLLPAATQGMAHAEVTSQLQIRNDDLQKELKQVQKNLHDASASEQKLRSKEERLQKTISTRDEELRTLRKSLADARSETFRIRGQLQSEKSQAKEEQTIRQELLGLKGNLKKTIFVIDISGSMANEFSGDYVRANWKAGDTAWSNVQHQIVGYLKFLPVESFRIICFNRDLHEFPPQDGQWATDRLAAQQFLASLTPSGLTGTEAALSRAAAAQPGSIILFTDGQPTRAVQVRNAQGVEETTSAQDPAQQTRILELVQSGKIKCPVNVIALNDYAIQSAGSSDPAGGQTFLSFLQELAGRSGGAFLGY